MAEESISPEQKAQILADKLGDRLTQVFKQLNTMQATVVKAVTMIDNLRVINMSLQNRIELLEGKSPDLINPSVN